MSQRYEREIDEIIKKTGADFRARTTLKQAFTDLQQRARHQAQRSLPSVVRIITPTRMGSIGIVLLLGAFFAKISNLAVLAVVVLMVAYLLSLAQGSRPSEPKWRGSTVDYRIGGMTLWARIKRRFQNRHPR